MIKLPDNIFVLNTLGMGIAIQLLARTTGEEIETWTQFIQATAQDQYKQLSAQEIQQIIDSAEVCKTA